jgi:hypothetical protein
MAWLGRSLREPASQSQATLVLVVCVIAMSLMSLVVVWQAQVISNQRDTIRWLETVKFGG